ncbi:MAG: hypothetical protein AB2693_21990, partial [Candidatus Thiodiazotropha sp.]
MKAKSTSVCANQDVPYVHSLARTVTPDVSTVEQKVPPELLQSTALKTRDWRKGQQSDRNVYQTLEYVALGQRPTAWQVQTSRTDKRFFKEWK